MLGDTKESPKQLQTPESGWVEGIQNLLKYGTSVAVLIYAVVYIIYWSFYTRLGVSPEEVGASYASTLLHSIGGTGRTLRQSWSRCHQVRATSFSLRWAPSSSLVIKNHFVSISSGRTGLNPTI
jgi:hypothetical protein